MSFGPADFGYLPKPNSKFHNLPTLMLRMQSILNTRPEMMQLYLYPWHHLASLHGEEESQKMKGCYIELHFTDEREDHLAHKGPHRRPHLASHYLCCYEILFQFCKLPCLPCLSSSLSLSFSPLFSHLLFLASTRRLSSSLSYCSALLLSFELQRFTGGCYNAQLLRSSSYASNICR